MEFEGTYKIGSLPVYPFPCSLVVVYLAGQRSSSVCLISQTDFVVVSRSVTLEQNN